MTVIMVGVRDRSETTFVRGLELLGASRPSSSLPFLLPLRGTMLGKEWTRVFLRQGYEFSVGVGERENNNSRGNRTGEFPLGRGIQRRAAAIDIHGIRAYPGLRNGSVRYQLIISP